MQVYTMLCGRHEDKTCHLPSTPQLGVMGGTSVVLISCSTGVLFLQVVMQEGRRGWTFLTHAVACLMTGHSYGDPMAIVAASEASEQPHHIPSW